MPTSYQIKLGDAEKLRLINRIEADFLSAKASHQSRMERFARYLQKWENRVEKPAPGDEGKPNHSVPMTQWHTFNKLARSLQALIGDDAEITARPTGPSDADKARKVGAYMTSRVFDQMEILTPLVIHLFQTTLYGRSIYYRPWHRREFDTLQDGKKERVCEYEGPGFFPEHPDNIVTPAERGVFNIQDFSYVIRRVPVTVDELQRGDGTLYQGTSDPEFVKSALNWAKTGYNDFTTPAQDPVTQEAERSQGVEFDSVNQDARRTLWMWEWYGKWRPLKRRGGDGAQDDLDVRETFEADWCVKIIPGMRAVVGVQDLLELYPKMVNRRPFGDSSLIKDGSYWSMGLGQLLESLEDEATANSRLFTAAGELAVWPLLFVKPANGAAMKQIRIEPGMMTPTEDPQGVNVVHINPNMEYAIAKQQDVLSMAERVDGITDQSLGRAVDRPNAPRTATGQLALIEEGNVRAYLDNTILREDMEQMITDFWDLDCDLAAKNDPGIWFRVTEETAVGVAGFDTRKGGAFMTPQEFGGKFDFRLKFATSAYAREAQAQKTLSFYQLSMTNPLVMSNPRALWVMLNRTAKALGIQDFCNIIPQPPDLDQPQTPDQEWNRMLEGDDEVSVNPQDHDQLHLMKHLKQLAETRTDPNPDVQAIHFLIRHIQETRQQMAAKQAMQALTNQLIQSIQPNGGPGAPALPQLLQAMQQGQQGGMPQPGGPPQGMPPGPGLPQGTGGMPQGGDAGGAPGIGMPPQGVGSQAAPQPQDGML